MKGVNKKVRNATACQVGNIKFKSQLEKMVYSTLVQLGFKPLYEPETHILWSGFQPVTPFYDKETDSQRKKRIERGDTNRHRLLALKTSAISGIRYTPDFYFKHGNLDVFIEAKGKENDVFYIKKKMFRHLLDRKYLTTGQHSIFFEIYTKKQLLQAIEIIKDYEKSIRKDGRADTVSSQEGCQAGRKVSKRKKLC